MARQRNWGDYGAVCTVLCFFAMCAAIGLYMLCVFVAMLTTVELPALLRRILGAIMIIAVMGGMLGFISGMIVYSSTRRYISDRIITWKGRRVGIVVQAEEDTDGNYEGKWRPRSLAGSSSESCSALAATTWRSNWMASSCR